MPSVRQNPLLLRAALLAVVVLALGLPRLLVLCSHGDGAASLEWAHPEGACCDHEGHQGHEGHAGEDATHEDVAAVPDGGCEHDSLAFDTAPPPRADAATDAAPPLARATVAFAPPAPPAPEAPAHPPATGPPRTDQRTELRASSLLLL